MFYTPPTHEEQMRTHVRPLNYYRLTYASSLLYVEGQWRAVRSPSSDLTRNFTEGVDYFKGGYEYDIDESLVDALEAAGFPSGPEPWQPISESFGYGEGTYGSGLYGAGSSEEEPEEIEYSYGPNAYGSGPYGG